MWNCLTGKLANSNEDGHYDKAACKNYWYYDQVSLE